MRRRFFIGGLGAVLVLGGCSGDNFTSANPARDAGGGPGASGSQNSGGAAGHAGMTGTGGALGSGGAVLGNDGSTATGGAPVGSGGTGIGIEAGVVEASSPSLWCDRQTALFCEDFDRYTHVDDLLNGWGNYSLVGGQFSFETDGPSKPNALRVVTTATSNVKTLVAKTLPAFGALPSRLRLEFTLRIDKAENIGALAGAAFAALLNGPEVTDGAVAMAVGGTLGGTNALEVAYVGPPRDGGSDIGSKNAQGPFPPLNQWIGRYALDIHYAASSSGRTGCAHLLAGGVDQLDSCLPLPATLSSPKAITVVLGVYSAGLFSNTGTVEIEFDNLILTSQ